MSSGLDSLLAAKVVMDFGIDVHGVCFTFAFDSLSDKHKRGEIEDLFRPIGMPLTVVDFTHEILTILKDPQHGFGSGVNPCIDCHLSMFKSAKTMMDEMEAKFLVTGEVVGQRPMSQMKHTLFHIDKVSGLKRLILRPLSAKLLPTTLPEEMGWVDREKLFGFSGRSRKAQIDLARRLSISGFNPPAGGCILTEPNFSRRVKAFFSHRGKDRITAEELELCRLGRHFWPEEHLHVVVGRDESDNRALETFKDGRWVFRAADTEKSPIVLASGLRGEDDRIIAAGITTRYCSRAVRTDVRIHYEGDGEEGILRVSPISDTILERWRV